jgi:predicted RNase H-like HicB family nuclease
MLFMKNYQFVAQVQKDVDTGLYIGVIPNLPGAHTQAKSLDELNINLKEVITLCLEEMTDEEIASIPEVVGSQNISVAI